MSYGLIRDMQNNDKVSSIAWLGECSIMTGPV